MNRKRTSADASGASRVTGRTRRPPGPKHESKRAAILKTAAQLFADNGYEATSLDQIADHLRIHKATLYHYVPNKETILYECLLASFEDIDTVIGLTRDKSKPLLERLGHFLRELSRAQNSDFGRCLLFVGQRPLVSSQGGKIRAFQRRLEVALRDLIMEGVMTSQLRPVDPTLVCALVFGAFNWVPRWFRPGKRLGSVDDVTDAFLDMLTTGLLPR